MPEDISSKPSVFHSAIDFSVGDLVRIGRGALEGIVAQIAGFTAERNCVLVSEDLPQGVRVVIGAHLLARAPENARVLARP